MSKFSVKRPFTIFVAVVVFLMLGAVSFTKMTTDLLPEFNIPYVVVMTTYPGASPDKIESTVTRPLESGLGTLNGVQNVTSTSSENYSMVMLEFEEDTNMDSAMVKLSSALDLVTLPEGAGTPMTMEVSADMMATMYVSVDYDKKDIYDLTDFVDETVVPRLERQNGVASVDETGAVSKTVEIRLDEKKIDALNDKLAAQVNKKLAETKEQLDEAQSQLDAAKSKMSDSKDQLKKQQDDTSDQLASASKAVDQALAAQASYEAQLNSLKASQKALETEKDAYEKAGVKENYQKINETFAGMQQAAGLYGIPADTLPSDVKDALEHPEKLETLQALMKQMGQEDAVKELTEDNLKQIDTIVNTRMGQIDTALANLEIEIKTAQAVLDGVNEQVQQASDSYNQLEKGKISAAAGFGSADAQLASGETALSDSEKELQDGIDAYEKARDQALKSANLDQVCSLDTLSQLIYAQNFAMPAGYIYEGDTQYLLKVGDEYNSADEMKDTVLCNIDGIGDVRLSDVAAVTWIDNSGSAYAKVNGNQAVLLSVYKASTAGTSDVSDRCNDAFEELEKEYDGLHITNLMDQGDYIDMIVQSVLSNLIYGAILAIIVLAVFLKSVKPTIVVAFSIPISVLVAVVLMYFSGVTLNIISLSGLALGVGMLVDNSIVVIENIYRLRGKGIPSARAAVMGAKQVAGAITSSTLTTICVFLPIIFTGGLVRQLFVDLALTIAYSLVASLLVALTLVPAMSSTLLRNTQEKQHKLFDRVMVFYEKVLRFCLRRKAVPLLIAAALLAGCVYQIKNTGLILLPDMGGNQMSVTMEAKPELSDEETFKLADDAMKQMQEIDGVETVGMMSGSSDVSGASAASLMGSGGTHNLTVYILLDEEAAKDNSQIAHRLETVMAGLDLEDYSVSTSNMDMSAMLGDGMAVNIYGEDTDELLKIGDDVMAMLKDIKGFDKISNGQEEGDQTLVISIDKDKAMRQGLTVAQIYSELTEALTTEKDATSLTVDQEQYNVKIVDETDKLTVDKLMDYEFEVEKTDAQGNKETETHKLKEFATSSKGQGLASVTRENQRTYLTITAETLDGYNTTLLSRQLQEKLDQYQAPDGYDVEIGGESSSIQDAMGDIILMLFMAVALIYLIMVAQFQSLLSPFIVLFTIPLAFTGGLLALYITRQEISLVAMMGFLMLAGVVVNNGIVFVDYTNQLRLAGMSRQEALVRTGISRMRPILMTALTTILAMSIMAVSKDAASVMSKGMAITVIGGLLYATLMTLFIVPVLYDLLFRKELKKVDIGDEKLLEEDELTIDEM
ncbi:Swarming motility protein SwrC [uncultured Roseburia sp.]|uniref:Efflux RND transporter permease subunit n=1 Tax=Brotonthovivens ammoniilytica TaxID=2981725 RepID=A0ABT2TM49_9FIRM|nr:efflux RND transporter permease subunit [Brotonthovivens ammoniilytica]MCU6763273.1 efflux RND transporter permease subunit [Brotonthovivens ammoniilytica]SCJ11609.1 Swarming motility protein SwrC [uncultured Roseburia sp.]